LRRAAILVFAIVVAASLASGAAAQGSVRTERVRFDQHSSSTLVKGEIKGRDVVDYQFEAVTGQALFVLMTLAKGSSSSTYFNVTAPGAETAMFIGSTSGREFHGTAPADGLYTVRVYLMGNAARQGRSAKYSLEIGVRSKGGEGAVSDETGPTRYDASGSIKCSAGKPTLDRQCGFRVIREKGKARAEIWIASPIRSDKPVYRVLYFSEKMFTTRGPSDLSWQRQEDNWWVGVDGKEFYFIPDAALFGG